MSKKFLDHVGGLRNHLFAGCGRFRVYPSAAIGIVLTGTAPSPCTYGPDIAKQILEKAPVAPKCGGFVAIGADVCNFLKPGAINRRDISCCVEMDA
jgi:hypothetical protein